LVLAGKAGKSGGKREDGGWVKIRCKGGGGIEKKEEVKTQNSAKDAPKSRGNI